MKNLLFISVSFPPKRDSESIQTGKYFKYLRRTNINITVVTSASPTLNMPVDESLNGYTEGFRNVVEVKIFENKYTNYIINKLWPSFLQKPDSKFSFFLQWKGVLKKVKQRPDVIYSRSYPISSALMALKLKKYYKVPWVMHLSDPWSEYPLVTFSKAAKTFNEKLEKEAFTLADKICFTSTKSIDVYSQKYPDLKNKYEYFPNVYDDDQMLENKHVFKEKLRYVYTGGMIGDRSPIYLLKVLETIQREEPLALENVEFLFAGEADRRNRGVFEEYGKLECVKYLGALKLKKATELQKSADVLIVIDNPLKSENEAVFFPSKVLDYLIAQRKILAITDNFSMTSRIISDKMGNCFEHNDKSGIKSFIFDSIEAFRQQNQDFFYTSEVQEIYSSNYQANRLRTLFDKL